MTSMCNFLESLVENLFITTICYNLSIYVTKDYVLFKHFFIMSCNGQVAMVGYIDKSSSTSIIPISVSYCLELPLV